MSEQEIKDTLADIKEMISADKNYFDKVKTDLMYDNIRPHVNRLLEDIFREKKEKVEKELSNVEFAIQRTKKWIDSKNASYDDTQKYNIVSKDISVVGDKLRDRSYNSYADVADILSRTIQTINELQTSIKINLNTMRSGYYNLKTSLDNRNNEIIEINRNKNKTFITNIILTIAPVLILIVWFMSIYPNLNASTTIVPAMIIVGGHIFTMAIKDKNGYMAAAIIGFVGFVGFSIVWGIVFLILRFFGHGDIINIIYYIVIIGAIIYAIFKKDGDVEYKLNNLKKETIALKEQINNLDQKIEIANNSI